LAPQAAQAQPTERSVSYDRFDVQIDLLPDGTFTVLETQAVRFDGTFRRAYRDIPLDKVSSITEVTVGEPGRVYQVGANQAGTFSTTRGDGQLRIQWWFPDTTNAVRTFEVRYRVRGGIRVYPGGDQIYWTAIPPGLPGPISSASVTVRFPTDVAPESLMARAYSGGAELQPAAVTSSEVRFEASRLNTGQALDARVQFPHGLTAAETPAWQEDYDRRAAYNSQVRPILNLLLLVGSLALLAGGGVMLFGAWFTRGRDPALGRVAPERETPPSDLPAGVVGVLVDEQADPRVVLATLLDLANRGYVRITQIEDRSLAGSSLDYQLELLKEPVGLRGFERTLLGTLFGSQTEARLSAVKERWRVNVPVYKRDLYREATERGLFPEDPDEVRERWRRRGWQALGLALVGGFLATALLGGAAELIWLPFAALGLLGIALLLTGPKMPRRSKAGAVEAAEWRAFGRHLAELPAGGNGAGETFGRYLPYAVALGVEQSWLTNFEAVGTAAPQWLGGGGPIIIGGPGGWGYFPPGFGGPVAGAGGGQGQPSSESGSWIEGGGRGPGGLEGASGGLAGLLNAASEALSSGGGGGWSGGGGDFGGGGGGGGGGGFD
jgi:hypothetical protein